MNNKTFYILWGEALVSTDRDTYISEWAISSLFDPDPNVPTPDYDAIIKQLGSIWDAAHMTVAQIRAATGLSQAAFAERFCISRRTVEDWCRGVRTPPDYIRLMMIELLGLIQR